jgi:hypothetical protein
MGHREWGIGHKLFVNSHSKLPTTNSELPKIATISVNSAKESKWLW